MTKIQKIWFGVFLAMFVVPEVLFSFIPFSIAFLLGKNFPSLFSLIVGPNFTFSSPGYLLILAPIEFLGAVGLLIFNTRYNQKYKASINIILTLAIILLSFDIWVFYNFYQIYLHGISF